MKKRAISLIILTLTGVLWYLYQGSIDRSVKAPVETIHLAAYAGMHTSLIWVAEELGYFTENNLEVIITRYESGVDSVQQVLAGHADIGTAAEFVVVSHSFERADLKVIGVIDTANTIEIVARKDRGIKHKTELQGKRIGLKMKSQAEFLLGSFLNYHGVPFTAVELSDMDPGMMAASISGGEVDAVIVWPPYNLQASEALGDNAVSWPAHNEQPFYFLLTTTGQFLEKKPAAAQRFLKALLQAERFIAEERSKAQEIVKNSLQTDIGFLQKVWLKHNFAVLLPQELIYAMEDEASWMINNGQTDKMTVPNYFDLMSLDGLYDLDPKAVTVIH